MDDDSSFCSSTVASSIVASSTASSKKRRAKSTPAKKVSKKKPKVPVHEKTPEANKVTKYLITPVATNPNVLARISTVASSVSSFGSPDAVPVYDYRVQSKTLPDSVHPKTDNPAWLDVNKKPTQPAGKQKLPTSALCTPSDIRSGQCFGCKYMFNNCLKKKYRDYCLQAVKNHIDDVGYDLLSKFSVRKAYHNEYMSQIRRDLKEATGFYEANQLLDIPLCMIKGSLNDALTVASGSAVGVPIVEYLMQQCRYGITQHQQNEEHERLRKEYEEFDCNVAENNVDVNDDDDDD